MSSPAATPICPCGLRAAAWVVVVTTTGSGGKFLCEDHLARAEEAKADYPNAAVLIGRPGSVAWQTAAATAAAYDR